MKIFLTDQHKNFPKHLDVLKSRPVMAYDKNRLTEKSTCISINATKQFEELDPGFLFDYKIFPSKILTFLTQWNSENRNMLVGDTIMQQVFLPPTEILSQKIIFGVRINEMINAPEKKGFSYETLVGHVEKGVSTFTIEKNNSEIIFKIQTFSSPGNMLTKLLGPVFSVPYQSFCTKAALNNVKQQLEK